jgi:hypothetical protein
MISGGDSAMMSPVVRISMPLSKRLQERRKARLVGSPAIGSSSMAPIRPMLRMSMTCGSPFSECNASPSSLQFGARVSRPFFLVGLERAEAGGAGQRVGRIGVAVEELDQVLGPGHEGVVDLLLDEAPRPSARTPLVRPLAR